MTASINRNWKDVYIFTVLIFFLSVALCRLGTSSLWLTCPQKRTPPGGGASMAFRYSHTTWQKSKEFTYTFSLCLRLESLRILGDKKEALRFKVKCWWKKKRQSKETNLPCVRLWRDYRCTCFSCDTRRSSLFRCEMHRNRCYSGLTYMNNDLLHYWLVSHTYSLTNLM